MVPTLRNPGLVEGKASAGTGSRGVLGAHRTPAPPEAGGKEGWEPGEGGPGTPADSGV